MNDLIEKMIDVLWEILQTSLTYLFLKFWYIKIYNVR